MKKIFTSMIRFYQKHISPLTPPSCRYYPTCSTYALEAVEKHGALQGGTMAAARILRCNPFVEGGVDEVPDYFTVRRNPENINDLYIPGQLPPMDEATKNEMNNLLEKYQEELKVSKELPDSLTTLRKIADVEELQENEMKQNFSEEELDYLFDLEIIPELPSARFSYFTLSEVTKNKHLSKEMESFDEGIVLGEDFPLIVLEETGIWYTNLPKLVQEFLIERGVTPEDVENKSYHLWLVLKAFEASTQNR